MIRIMHQFRSRSTDLERYLYLRTLKNSNSALFYRAVLDHMDEIAPVIYTPTVGEACIKFSHIYNSGIVDGMYLSLEDRGRVKEVLRNWPYEEVDISVVTDGSRILGLGDLGVNGMGG